MKLRSFVVAAFGVALLAGLTACAPDPPAPTTPEWVGTWSGTATQTPSTPGYETFPVSIVLTDSNAGASGTVDYPSLSCSGTLTEVTNSGTELVMTETITSNPNDLCIPTGTWTFTQSGHNTLLGTYSATISNVPITVTVALQRQGG